MRREGNKLIGVQDGNGYRYYCGDVSALNDERERIIFEIRTDRQVSQDEYQVIAGRAREYAETIVSLQDPAALRWHLSVWTNAECFAFAGGHRFSWSGERLEDA
jgi:hypothetical protein